MNAAKKSSSFLLIFLAASSLLFIQAASAQSKPSTPEFTLQTQTQANDTTITLTIQNQPFDAASHRTDGFFYNVRIRTGGGNWTELYSAEDWYPQQSNDSTTIITCVAGETAYLQRETSQGHPAISTSGTVEFEVQAMIGHRDRGALQPGLFMPYVFVGMTSDWSAPQAVTLGATPSATVTTTSTASQSQPSGKPDAASWAIVVLLVVVVAALLVAAVIFRHKSGKTEVKKQTP